MHENIAMYLRRGYEETGRFRQDGFERVFFRKGNNRNIPVIAGSRGLSWC
jgi:hypothetical protein